MKSLIVSLALLATTAQAREFTLVTETTVDAANLFEGRSERPISAADALVPASMAHRYTMRANYTVIATEADAKIEKVPAGCAGPWVLHCWNDHLSGELDVIAPGSNARFELLDRDTGRILSTRTLALESFPVKLSTVSMSDSLDFSGTSEVNIRHAGFDEEEFPNFALADGKHSLFFMGLFESAIYDGAKLVIVKKGGANHYELAGLVYGGHTPTGDHLDLSEGASYLTGDVAITNLRDANDSFAVGAPGARNPRLHARVVKVIK